MACHLVSAKPLSEPRLGGILIIGPLETKFSEILIKIRTFSFKKINLKLWSGKCRPSCLGLNVLRVLTSRTCIGNEKGKQACRGLQSANRQRQGTGTARKWRMSSITEWTQYWVNIVGKSLWKLKFHRHVGGIHFTNDLCGQNWNYMKIVQVYFLFWCSNQVYNFAHATKAYLLLHEQNCDLIGSSFFPKEQYVFSPNSDDHNS